MCESRAAMLGLVLAFSSPVDQSSIREDVKALVKEALGIYLSRPVCFSDTQPGYLTCWWTTQAVRRKFVFIWKNMCVYVCEGTWCIPPMTIWVFSTSLTASVCMRVCVFMCVQHTPLIRATVGGEKSESCQAQNSQIGALSACVDITIQNSPTFLLYPPSVWTLVSLAAASCSVFLAASRSTNESRLFFALWNK